MYFRQNKEVNTNCLKVIHSIEFNSWKILNKDIEQDKANSRKITSSEHVKKVWVVSPYYAINKLSNCADFFFKADMVQKNL